MTGIEVTLNVIAEFIGGIWVEGNAVSQLDVFTGGNLTDSFLLLQLAMNYFKSFGYVVCAHAISFANDLKLAHYIKVGHRQILLHILTEQKGMLTMNTLQIPPRHTFVAQMVATLISTFICTAVMNFQVSPPSITSPSQTFHLTILLPIPDQHRRRLQ